MGESRLFLVRVWVNGQMPRAAAREVESEDTALFDDPVALGRHLLGRAAPLAPAVGPAGGEAQ